MTEENSIIRVIRTPGDHSHLFNHQETAQLARVATRTLLKYWRYGLIEPRNRGERYGIFFDEQAIYRIRKAESVRVSMKTNIPAAVAILKLMDQVEDLKAELRFSRKF